jgi:hypothetical protein
MSGGMQRKQRVHAAVPVSHPDAFVLIIFILNIKTPACGTNIGASSAVDAGKSDVFPEQSVIKVRGAFRF